MDNIPSVKEINKFSYIDDCVYTYILSICLCETSTVSMCEINKNIIVILMYNVGVSTDI